MKNHIYTYVIGFITLITAVAVLMSHLQVFGLKATPQFLNWGLGSVLAEIIMLFVLITKTSLKKEQMVLYLKIPDKYSAIADNLEWDQQECYAISSGRKEVVELKRAMGSTAWEVVLPSKIFNQVSKKNSISFELKDINDIKWKIVTTSYFANVQELKCSDIQSLMEVINNNLEIVDHD